jgi:hypothetical protein
MSDGRFDRSVGPVAPAACVGFVRECRGELRELHEEFVAANDSAGRASEVV